MPYTNPYPGYSDPIWEGDWDDDDNPDRDKGDPRPATPPAPTPPASTGWGGGNDYAAKKVSEWYQKYLGRTPSWGEISSHIGNPGGEAAVEALIRDSPEAKAYTTRATEEEKKKKEEEAKTAKVKLQGNATRAWDQQKLEDPTKGTSIKYIIGRILDKYQPTTAGMASAWAEISKLYPTATWNGKDSITGLPGMGSAPVDVLAGASRGGESWWWGVPEAGGATTPPKTVAKPPTYTPPTFTAAGGYPMYETPAVPAATGFSLVDLAKARTVPTYQGLQFANQQPPPQGVAPQAYGGFSLSDLLQGVRPLGAARGTR